MMMLYSAEPVERELAAFWKSWSNGAPSNVKLTVYPRVSRA